MKSTLLAPFNACGVNNKSKDSWYVKTVQSLDWKKLCVHQVCTCLYQWIL